MSINNLKRNRFRFDVAFSFAEEDRAFVDRVAELLKDQKIKMYYDDHERVSVWGKDLLLYLDEVYRSDARFCVMFISKYYKEKRWTMLEADWAKARSFFMKNKEYILPFRLDDSEIPGIRNSIGYLSIEDYDERKLAQAIIEKVQRKAGARPSIRTLAAFGVFIMAGIGFALYKPPKQSLEMQSVLGKILEKRQAWHFRAVCEDSMLSQSTGAGTCSHHGGVARYLDTTIYGKSKEECQRALCGQSSKP